MSSDRVVAVVDGEFPRRQPAMAHAGSDAARLRAELTEARAGVAERDQTIVLLGVLGEDGQVVGLRTERTELDGTGNVRGTGAFTDWPVQSVYRAVGYLSDNLAGLPFDGAAGVVPNDGGRVIDIDGEPLPGAYVTGWIKRGPIGLIGHTKSDAAQTIDLLLSDLDVLIAPEQPELEAVDRYLNSRDIAFTTWEDWEKLDAHEILRGES